MTVNSLLIELGATINRSIYDIPILIVNGEEMFVRTLNDERIIQIIAEKRTVLRWAIYNDESGIIIELEV